MSIEIKTMTEETMSLVPNQDQGYTVTGRMRLHFDGAHWSYTESLLDKPYEKTFPEEDMELPDYLADPHKTVLLAFVDGTLAGTIRLSCAWNLYGFIDDIGVFPGFRRQGIGKVLISAAEDWAKEKNMKGLGLEMQDINLNAAHFYECCGFEIGGVNTMLYSNFGLDEIAVFWYKRF